MKSLKSLIVLQLFGFRCGVGTVDEVVVSKAGMRLVIDCRWNNDRMEHGFLIIFVKGGVEVMIISKINYHLTVDLEKYLSYAFY